MLSFNKWREIQKANKPVNESFLGLGSMTLGFGQQPTKIGKIGMSEKNMIGDDADMVPPAEAKDDPKKVPAKDLKEKSSKKGKGKKSSNKCDYEGMTAEEVAWWESVNGHLDVDPSPRFSSGLDKVMEEKLIDPNQKAEIKKEDEPQEDPKPGEPGFAPQGRIGNIGSYAEWSAKYFPKK